MRLVHLAALTAALIASLAVPVAAHATYAQVDEIFSEDLRLVVGGSDGVNDYINVSFTEGVLTVSDEAGVLAGPGCSRVDSADNRVVQCVTATEGRALRHFQFSGGSGNDGLRVHTSLPNDIGVNFMGGDGADIVKGSPAGDLIQPGAGQDFVEALGGDDQLNTGSAWDGENDTFHMGDGQDQATFGRTGPVTISMSQVTPGTGTAGSGSEGDALTGNEIFYTGSGNDEVLGGPGDEVVYAGFGDDVLMGGGGEDRLHGAEGEDALLGDGGDDELEGGADLDDMVGGEGDDVLRAEDRGADQIACDDEPEEIDTPGTADVLYADPGLDPDDPDCEILAPAFTGTPAIAGSLNAGSELTLADTQTAGRPAPTITGIWWSCSSDQYDDCEERATSPVYVPVAADVGRFLYAEVVADNGGLGWSETELVGPVAEALPPGDDQRGDDETKDQSQDQKQGPQQSQGSDSGPGDTLPSAETVGSQLLGSALGVLRRKGALRRLRRGVRLPFTAGRPGTALVEVLSGAPRGRARAAAKVRVLARGGRSYAAAGAGAIKVRLTKAGKAKLRRKRTARLVLRVTFAAPGAAPVVLTKKVTLKR